MAFLPKTIAQVEIMNDTTGEVVNFYRIMQNNFAELQKEIACSLHSRDLHRQARVVYENPDMFSQIKRAWAFWMLTNQGFRGMIGSQWAYDNYGRNTKSIKNKREDFTEKYAMRLQNVQIECCDALHVINVRDTDGPFFYLDPPYFQVFVEFVSQRIAGAIH
jgi:DNA adenine methylase